MAKKTKMEEIISKAKFADNVNLYDVTFRDFDTLKTVSLPRFLDESENFQTIPVTRITLIKRHNEILYSKSN
jgi:hypothetical protein